MRVLAASQIIFGGLTAWCAWFLADQKGYEIIHQPGTVWNPPPDIIIETALTILSLIIFGLAMAQAIRHVKLANLQIVCGVAALTISAFLFGRTSAFGYWETSNIYDLAYIVMAFGLAVSIIGIIQFFYKKRGAFSPGEAAAHPGFPEAQHV